jgi:ABC-type branched-subunit amino acid transport system substrate-binding protein
MGSTPRWAARRLGWVRRMLPRGAVISALCVSMVAAACSSTTPTSSTSSTNPVTTPTGGGTVPAVSTGVTDTSITVGQVDELSSPIPGLFKGAEDGTKAYFDYINTTQGGVNGRKLILDAQDSGFASGQVASITASQIQHEFALVGGFSLLDGAEKNVIDFSRTPAVEFSLDPSMFSDPLVYSAIPNPGFYYPLAIFKYLKSQYPQAVRKVGIIWENATATTRGAEASFENAMKSVGFQIVYDHGVGPFDTNFLTDIIAMKNAGVKMVYNLELPDNYAAKLAQQMQQQNFQPIHLEGAAYSDRFLSLAGSSANGIYIEQGYALYLGQDANVNPAVKLFTTWMHRADPNPNFEIESVYGWSSAQLFVQALQQAGNPPTRAGLVAALNKITFFNSGGLVPLENPAQGIVANCFLLAQVQHGKIVRVSPTPSTGFYCGQTGYFQEPGYRPLVRPAT